MADLSKNDPGQKMKTLPSVQTSNRGWINPPRYGNELKYIPHPYVSRQGWRHEKKTHRKGSNTHRE